MSEEILERMKSLEDNNKKQWAVIYRQSDELKQVLLEVRLSNQNTNRIAEDLIDSKEERKIISNSILEINKELVRGSSRVDSLMTFKTVIVGVVCTVISALAVSMFVPKNETTKYDKALIEAIVKLEKVIEQKD